MLEATAAAPAVGSLLRRPARCEWLSVVLLLTSFSKLPLPFFSKMVPYCALASFSGCRFRLDLGSSTTPTELQVRRVKDAVPFTVLPPSFTASHRSFAAGAERRRPVSCREVSSASTASSSSCCSSSRCSSSCSCCSSSCCSSSCSVALFVLLFQCPMSLSIA